MSLHLIIESQKISETFPGTGLARAGSRSWCSGRAWEWAPSYRDCYVVPEGSQAPEPTSCLNTHREEVLFNVVMDVTGQPSDTTSWSDENWAEYDEACASLTSILIGGTQPHLVTRAEYPDPNRPLVSAPPSASTATARVFSCFVRPDSDGQLPAGTVVGRGSSLIEIIP